MVLSCLKNIPVQPARPAWVSDFVEYDAVNAVELSLFYS